MKTTSHRINSRKHLKELLSGDFRYFTLEYENSKVIHWDGSTPLISESYRIPNKVKEELADQVPIIKEAKKVVFFKDYKQFKRFIRVNLDRGLPNNQTLWIPLLISVVTTDSMLYYGHEFMKYWQKAKRNHDTEGLRYFALGEQWKKLNLFGKILRTQFSNI